MLCQAGLVRLYSELSDPYVYSCTLEGRAYMWDCRSGHLVRTWTGHTSEILDFDIFEGRIEIREVLRPSHEN